MIILDYGSQERVDNALDLFGQGEAGMRWHSMTCICDECLNADALVDLLGDHVDERHKPDISGLIKATAPAASNQTSRM